MALTATIHHFTIELSHADRGVYESLDLRVARHPSESAEFLCARVLAFCLEQREGLAFSKGLSDRLRDSNRRLRLLMQVTRAVQLELNAAHSINMKLLVPAVAAAVAMPIESA